MGKLFETQAGMESSDSIISISSRMTIDQPGPGRTLNRIYTKAGHKFELILGHVLGRYILQTPAAAHQTIENMMKGLTEEPPPDISNGQTEEGRSLVVEGDQTVEGFVRVESVEGLVVESQMQHQYVLSPLLTKKQRKALVKACQALLKQTK